MNIESIIGVAIATAGGVLLATQIPSDAVMYRDRETGHMTLDSGNEAMKNYERKVWLYRIGLLLLAIGGAVQAHAASTGC